MDLTTLALKREIKAMAQTCFKKLSLEEKKFCSEKLLVIAGVTGKLEAMEFIQKGSSKKYDFLTVINTIDEFFIEIYGC